jgi:formiminotetrahydrofolate cyclodeaminase
MLLDNLTVRDETIEAFLGQLAARVPAPGGGATAALHAAQSAALLAMVARYSDGAKYDADLMARFITEADGIRDEALTLAEADAAAFGAVAAPTSCRRTPTRRSRPARRPSPRRSGRGGAAAGRRDPAALLLVELAEELLPAGNRNVITDVAAAAEAARAAAVTARVNIEVNLRGLKDPSVLGELASHGRASPTSGRPRRPGRGRGARGDQPMTLREVAVRTGARGGHPGPHRGRGGRTRGPAPSAAAERGHRHRRRGERLVRPVARRGGGQGRDRLRGRGPRPGGHRGRHHRAAERAGS